MNFSEIFGPDGISEDIIIGIAALAAFINVFLIYRVMLVRDPNASRIRELSFATFSSRLGVAVF